MRALAFAATFICFFFMTYAFLGLVDALPNPPESADDSVESTDTPERLLLLRTKKLPGYSGEFFA